MSGRTFVFVDLVDHPAQRLNVFWELFELLHVLLVLQGRGSGRTHHRAGITWGQVRTGEKRGHASDSSSPQELTHWARWDQGVTHFSVPQGGTEKSGELRLNTVNCVSVKNISSVKTDWNWSSVPLPVFTKAGVNTNISSSSVFETENWGNFLSDYSKVIICNPRTGKYGKSS